MAKPKTTITGQGSTSLGGNLIKKLNSEYRKLFLGNTRSVLDRQNQAIIISDATLTANSELMQALKVEDPDLYNSIYTSMISAINRKIPNTITDKTKISDPGIYKIVGPDFIIPISVGYSTSKNNFARIREILTEALFELQSKYRPRLDKKYEELFFQNYHPFKKKSDAAKYIKNWTKIATFKQSLMDAGFSSNFTIKSLDTEFLKSPANNNPSVRKYDVLYSAIKDLEEKGGQSGAVSRIFASQLPAIEIGHLGGAIGYTGGKAPSSPLALKIAAGKEAVKRVRSSIDASDAKAVAKWKRFYNNVLKAEKELKKFDEEGITTSIEQEHINALSKLKVVITVPQHFIDNNDKSVIESEIFNKYLRRPIQEVAAFHKSSPSFLDFVEMTLINSMIGKKLPRSKTPPKEYKWKPDKKSSLKAILAQAKKIRIKAKKSKPRPKQEVPVSGLDLFNLKELINQMLAKNIQKRMDGAGGRLQYQTGRFADSAELLTLTRDQAEVLRGTYTYMKSPYDVFLPGHKMGTPQRDPRIYIEGAAREAAMTILKDKFPGIALTPQ